MKEMDCPPDKNTDILFARALVPLIDPENKGNPLSGERLEEVIGKLKESGRCQRELQILELHWGERLSYREIGEVIAEEEGRKGPYLGERMMRAEDNARHVLSYYYRYYTRFGRLPPDIEK